MAAIAAGGGGLAAGAGAGARRDWERVTSRARVTEK